MRKLIVLTVAVALLAALAATALAATKSVKVGDNYFVRSSGVPTVTINRGDRLRFNWRGSNPHNVRGVGISLGKSCRETRSSGTCRTPRLTKRGTFTVYCEVHGKRQQRMRLRIR